MDIHSQSKLIKEIAEFRLGGIVDTMEPSQYDSELKMDIEQDLWLALLLKVKEEPLVTYEQLKDHLKGIQIVSEPDLNVVYGGESPFWY